MAQRILFIFRHSPYGSALAREGLEALLAAGVFEQEIAVLFLNDGVLQLLKNQQTIGTKNHVRMMSALPLYGVELIYADQQSLEERAIQAQDLLSPVEILPPSRTRSLINGFDQILSF